MPASGRFVADSGRSIFLEQHFAQHGNQRTFRWEIPYQYIVRLEETGDSRDLGESREALQSTDAASVPAGALEAAEPQPTPKVNAARASGGSPLLPLHRPKTA